MQKLPTLQKILLEMFDFQKISKQIKVLKGVSHVFRESEGCGREFFLGASPPDPFILSTPVFLGWRRPCVAGFLIHAWGAIHCVIPFLKESTEEGFVMTGAAVQELVYCQMIGQ